MKPSRQVTRALRRDVETVIDADRRFFKARPRRSYRIRVAHEYERVLVSLETNRPAPKPLPSGFTEFVAVRQITPGVRERRFYGAMGAVSDSEDQARHVFDHIGPNQGDEVVLGLFGWEAP